MEEHRIFFNLVFADLLKCLTERHYLAQVHLLDPLDLSILRV